MLMSKHHARWSTINRRLESAYSGIDGGSLRRGSKNGSKNGSAAEQWVTRKQIYMVIQKQMIERNQAKGMTTSRQARDKHKQCCTVLESDLKISCPFWNNKQNDVRLGYNGGATFIPFWREWVANLEQNWCEDLNCTLMSKWCEKLLPCALKKTTT